MGFYLLKYTHWQGIKDKWTDTASHLTHSPRAAGNLILIKTGCGLSCRRNLRPGHVKWLLAIKWLSPLNSTMNPSAFWTAKSTFCAQGGHLLLWHHTVPQQHPGEEYGAHPCHRLFRPLEGTLEPFSGLLQFFPRISKSPLNVSWYLRAGAMCP